MLAAGGTDATAFIELGAIVLGLAVLARIAERAGFSPIPLYLLAGLFFGDGGFHQLDVSEDFLDLTSQIGVVLLLLALGLEYTADELRRTLRSGLRDGAVDLVANALPGLAAGILLGWGGKETLLLAGVTTISSSGVIAKVLADFGRYGNRETPTVLSILVLEDLAMAAYLPLVGVVLAGTSLLAGMVSLAVAISVVVIVLLFAIRSGHVVTRLLASRSDEALLLGLLGSTLLVGGLAEQAGVSAAVGAFLVGIAVSGPVQERASELVQPLRDLFAAIFFLVFALRIDPGDLPPVAFAAIALAVVSAITKFGSAWYSTTRAGIGVRGRTRAATVLISRGEFSIVIAELGTVAGLDPRLAALAAGYVLVLASAGPILTRYADPIGERLQARTLRRA
ncbi:MAG TPA: cation:proton antiporter [Acidimicrobiia bacterium]|nr:cation:proton antiporter [Acidimicrobiia bacterium]